MTTPAEEVIGFDLGHGESAIARIALTPNATPQILPVNTKNSQMTAVGRYDGHVVIGETAIASENVTDIRVGFKVRPPGTPETRAAIQDFVRYYHDAIARGQVQDVARTHWFVGCPTGWSAAEVTEYQSLLATVLPHVTVVRESRAALVQAKEEGKLTPEQLRAAILVMDFGSSTIDVSYVIGGVRDESLDAGTELGAHLIEKEILRRAVRRSAQRDAIDAWFTANPGEMRIAEIYCREIKERYWGHEKTPTSRQRPRLIPVGAGLVLQVALDAAEMEDILTESLWELDGASWNDALRRFLDDVRAALGRRAMPQVLLLTGGPSKMPFVQELCRERFPEARFVWLTPPEEAVAMGLARWGSLQLRTSAFSEEVDAICRRKVPAIVGKHMDDLRIRLASQIAQGLATDVVAKTAREWREGKIKTLDAMKEKTITRADKWIHGRVSQSVIRNAFTPVLETINHEVDDRTKEVCDRHGIPHASLRLQLDAPMGDRQYDVTIGPFDGFAEATMVIATAILFVLTGIAKAAMVSAGPPGWVVGGLIAMWAAIFGAMKLNDEVTSADIPLFVRKRFLSEARLATLVRDATTKLDEKVRDAFGPAEMKNISDEIVRQVSSFLGKRAEEVKWIIE